MNIALKNMKLKKTIFKNSLVLNLIILLLVTIIIFTLINILSFFYENSYLGSWESTLTHEDLQNQVLSKIYQITNNEIIETTWFSIPIQEDKKIKVKFEINYQLSIQNKTYSDVIYKIENIKLENIEIEKDAKYFEICATYQVCQEMEQKLKENISEYTKNRINILKNKEVKIIKNEFNQIYLAFSEENKFHVLKRK